MSFAAVVTVPLSAYCDHRCERHSPWRREIWSVPLTVERVIREAGLPPRRYQYPCEVTVRATLVLPGKRRAPGKRELAELRGDIVRGVVGATGAAKDHVNLAEAMPIVRRVSAHALQLEVSGRYEGEEWMQIAGEATVERHYAGRRQFEEEAREAAALGWRVDSILRQTRPIVIYRKGAGPAITVKRAAAG